MSTDYILVMPSFAGSAGAAMPAYDTGCFTVIRTEGNIMYVNKEKFLDLDEIMAKVIDDEIRRIDLLLATPAGSA